MRGPPRRATEAPLISLGMQTHKRARTRSQADVVRDYLDILPSLAMRQLRANLVGVLENELCRLGVDRRVPVALLHSSAQDGVSVGPGNDV